MNTGKGCYFQWGFSLKHPCLNNLLFSQVLLNVHCKFHVSKTPSSTTRIFTGNKTWWFIHTKHITETFVIGGFSMELVSLSALGISPEIDIPTPNPRNQPKLAHYQSNMSICCTILKYHICWQNFTSEFPDLLILAQILLLILVDTLMRKNLFV